MMVHKKKKSRQEDAILTGFDSAVEASGDGSYAGQGVYNPGIVKGG